MASRKRSGRKNSARKKSPRKKARRKNVKIKNARVSFSAGTGRITIAESEKVTHMISDFLGGRTMKATVRAPADRESRHNTIVDVGCS